MRLKKLYLFLLAWVCILNPCYSQDFDWLKTYGNTAGAYVNVLSADTNGGCTALLWVGGPADIAFDTINYSNAKGAYLVKHDKKGKVTNARFVGNFLPKDLCRDNSGNFYITTDIVSSSSVTIGSATLYISGGSLVFAKYDKDFNFVWAAQTGSNNTGSWKVIHSGNNVYFICNGVATTTIGSTTYNLGTNGSTSIFGELNQSNGTILWSNYLNIPKSNLDGLVVYDLLNLKGKLYISGVGGNSGTKIGADTFYRLSGYVARTDTVGNYEKRFHLPSKQTRILSISSDGEHLYFCGWFVDSIQWGSKKIAPQYSSYNAELYAASITASFQPRWFFRPKILDANRGGKIASLKKVVCSNGYFYFGGVHDTNILIDSNTLKTTTSDILILKMDYLGNILWATNGGGVSANNNTLGAISDKHIFAGGYFTGNVKFGSHTATAKGTGGDAYVTKISNYFITRGFVKSGPYCAGDTIRIPYTRFGNFDSSNTFIAQLSDENGNFETGYRELGRLKTNKDSVILGKLPLFQVTSSKSYRIRILSTKPPVQSYYRIDTLRLLIYSRDKADPGPPDTICRGDTIQLSTYGGTKWNWSPTGRINDVSVRQPLVWPDNSATYRIIIGDSSGCGEIDTGYKQIIVRKSPKAFLDFNDTLVCFSDRLKIPVSFKFGDSTTYSWQWYLVNAPSSFFKLRSGKLNNTDTLVYNSYAEANKPVKLAVVVSDGCSNKSDTTYVTIRGRETVEISSLLKDTVICTGTGLSYTAQSQGGFKQNYQYKWMDLNKMSVLSLTDTLSLNSPQNSTIRLTVNDGCLALGDTAMFEVKVKAELKAITNLEDTTLCSGKTIIYTATGKGGDTTAYKFNWILNNNLVDTTSTLTSTLTSTSTLTLTSTSTLTLILKDNCSPDDTIQKTITIKPTPKADFTWDLACSKTITKFKFTGTKPAAPIATAFRWNFNNEAISSIENPSHKFSSAGTSTSTLILTSSNGCSDSVKKTIEIKPQSKADFTANDVCENDSAVFINKSLDATSYSWRFGDGLKSTKDSPKHLYNIGGVTKTFNVSLVAVVKDGCSDSIIKAISVNSNPNADFTYVLTGAKLDLKATVLGHSKYRWKFGANDSVTTTSGTYTHYFTKPGLHNICLKVFNLAECTSQSCQSMTVGISTIEKPKGFKIYPNPNTGNFTIEIDNPTKDISIEVYDLLGNLIKTIETESSRRSYSVEIKIANGVYLVKVTNGGTTSTQKVTINK